MMDIYKYMSDNELKKAVDLTSLVNKVKETSNHAGFDFYYKVFPGSIGTTIYFVCEDLHIETNITDHEIW